MKKAMAMVVVLTVVLAFLGGLFIAESQAKPPKPCQRQCVTDEFGCFCCRDCCPGQICPAFVCVCPL